MSDIFDTIELPKQEKFSIANQDSQPQGKTDLFDTIKPEELAVKPQTSVNQPQSGLPQKNPKLQEINDKVEQFRQNLIRDIGQTASGIGQAVMHPGQTIKGVANLAGGELQKIPGIGGLVSQIPGAEDRMKLATAVNRDYGQKYGGLSNIANTLYNQPVSAAMDLSTLLGGVGGAASKIGEVGNLEKLAQFGGALSKAGEVVDPLRAAGTAVAEPLKSLAPKVMAGAEKSYGKVLGATTKTEKDLATKVLPEITTRKPFVWTREGLQTATGRKLNLAGEALEQGYANLGDKAKLALNPVLDGISNKIESLKINGTLPPESTTLANKLNDIAGTMVDIAKSDDAPLQSMREYRKLLDERVLAGKKVYPTDVENITRDAQRIAANIIRKEIAKQNPSIARLNAEFSFQKKLSDLLETTTPKAKSALSGVRPIVGEFGGRGFEGLFVNLGKLISDNVAWKSFKGSMESRLSESLARGDIGKANAIVANFLKTGAKAGATNE